MNILICGIGRAGKAMAEKVLNSKEHKLIGIICRKESKNANNDLGQILYPGKDLQMGINIIPIENVVKEYNDVIDVVIDFSNREMALPLIDLCGKLHSNLVLCTTNHSDEELAFLRKRCDEYNIGMVYAPNLTIGVNLLMEFVKKISNVCREYNFEIIEKHPQDKSKPTATARIISQQLNREYTPIHSVRINGYVGSHEVVGSDGTERITIIHESLSREAFANGALLASSFIYGKKGFFLMKDVIENLCLNTK